MFHLKRKASARAAMQIAVSAVLILAVAFACRFLFFRSFTVMAVLSDSERDYVQTHPDRVSVRLSDSQVAEAGPFRLSGNTLRIPVYAKQPGSLDIDVTDADGNGFYIGSLHVTRFLTVHDHSTGNFTGDSIVLAAFTLFLFSVAAIMFWHFRRAEGPAFYSYSTIYFAGFSIFALVSAIHMLIVSLQHILLPDTHFMYSVFSAMTNASGIFILCTSPLLLAFSIAMAVSNVALLRHERPRLANLLGILIAVLLVGGAAFLIIYTGRNFSGSEMEYRIRRTVDSVLETFYVYFECMLAGSVICGLKAAKHRPAFHQDYILILGCRFFPDGTLTPLLKGRADAALAFWKAQKEATGKEAVFVPSGGQGPDESMPEAEAMRQYLLSQGVPDHLILPEDQSKNTYQNMAFSKKLIEERGAGSSAAFSTTNYHVFRSGVWSRLAGLNAEGIGAGTKWWFWPNAFMREVVGLLQNRIKQEVVLLILVISYFAALSMLLP